jgi:hypothetical protein
MTQLTTLFVGRDDGPDPRNALPEFSLVALLRDATGTTGARIAAGTVGTIVEMCGEGAAYLVEFDDPDEVAMIPADHLRLAA